MRVCVEVCNVNCMTVYRISLYAMNECACIMYLTASLNLIVICAGRTAKTNVRKAMALWMAHTCIRFVPKTREDTDYVQFSELPG